MLGGNVIFGKWLAIHTNLNIKINSHPSDSDGCELHLKISMSPHASPSKAPLSDKQHVARQISFLSSTDRSEFCLKLENRQMVVVAGNSDFCDRHPVLAKRIFSTHTENFDFCDRRTSHAKRPLFDPH